jgi:hypothetical protein
VVGGVEAVVEVMKKFPKCQALQTSASSALRNLTACNIGRKKAVKVGGIDVLLAAVNNHLSSVNVCGRACWTLANIVLGSKENIERLIALGGTAAVDKVSNKWPDNDKVQARAQSLIKILHSQPVGRSGSESSKVATEVPSMLNARNKPSFVNVKRIFRFFLQTTDNVTVGTPTSNINDAVSVKDVPGMIKRTDSANSTSAFNVEEEDSTVEEEDEEYPEKRCVSAKLFVSILTDAFCKLLYR